MSTLGEGFRAAEDFLPVFFGGREAFFRGCGAFFAGRDAFFDSRGVFFFGFAVRREPRIDILRLPAARIYS